MAIPGHFKRRKPHYPRVMIHRIPMVGPSLVAEKLCWKKIKPRQFYDLRL
jgi:hypothetical protein